MSNFSSKSSVLFPVNVQILQTTNTGRKVVQTYAKNLVLKDFGLYPYARFIMGSISQTDNLDQYIPKYIALGSNGEEQTDYTGGYIPTTDVRVGIDVNATDTALYKEFDDGLSRIKLNRTNYIEDYAGDSFIKVQYEAFIPEDRYENTIINELALMTSETGNTAFARVSKLTTPIIKTPGTVIQIIWEVVIKAVATADRYVPVNKDALREATDKAIEILLKAEQYPDGNYNYEDVSYHFVNIREYLESIISYKYATINPTLDTAMYLLLNNSELVDEERVKNILKFFYYSRPQRKLCW